jgi:hypothetical protein
VKPIALPIASIIGLTAMIISEAFSPLWALLIAAPSFAGIFAVYLAVVRQLRREARHG